MGNAPTMGDDVFGYPLPSGLITYYQRGAKGFTTPTWQGVICEVWVDPKWQYTVANDEVTITGYTGAIANPVIPDTIGGLPVTTIGNRAFFERQDITGTLTLTGDLVIPEGVTSIGGGAFRGCSGFTGDLVIPEGVTSILDGAFASCSGFTGSLVFPEGVTSIEAQAFFACTGLTGSLVFPEGVTSIGRSAFAGCTGLTGSLVLPEGLTAIEMGIFEGCSGFTGNLMIPEGVTSIGSYAFCFGSGFTGSLVLPSTLETMGENVFYDCSGLTGNVDIPMSVVSMAGDVFSSCTGLASVTFKGNAPELGVTGPFAWMADNFKVYFHQGKEGFDASEWQGIDLEMIPNRAPRFRIIGNNKTIKAGETITFEVIADDEDAGDVLQYSATKP